MDIPKNLLIARRALEEILEFELIQDWKIDNTTKKWYLIFKIIIESNINIDKETYWTALINNDSPYSEIEIYPEKTRGLSNTYPHQSNNGLNSKLSFLKSGKICLKKQNDYISDKNMGLFENINSLIEWIKQADKNILLKEGDYFEKLDYNIYNNYTIVFNEDFKTYEYWNNQEHSYGYTELKNLNKLKIITIFKDYKNKNIIHNNSWGGFINNFDGKELGIWILLKEFLVLNKWQAPNTFEELEEAFQLQNKSFFGILSKLIPKLIDDKEHIVSIGFPMPEIVGNSQKIIFWQNFVLPKLAKNIKGFRKTEINYFNYFKNNLLVNNLIQWEESENWNQNNLLKRGKYSEKLCDLNFLIIGAGSLASVLSEMLVRNGITKLGIIDFDIFKAGNLARHTLTLEYVSEEKVGALKKRLENLNPHVRIEIFSKKFDYNFKNYLSKYNVIIDCTANERVLDILSELKGEQKLFSASFGYNANILYLYCGTLNIFEKEIYLKKISPYVVKDLNYIKSHPLPWEGIGCWSPVFPAKYSEVNLIGSTIAELIIKFIESEEKTSKYFIYEKFYDEAGYLVGFRNVNL